LVQAPLSPHALIEVAAVLDAAASTPPTAMALPIFESSLDFIKVHPFGRVTR